MGRTVAPRAAYKSAMPTGFFKQLNEEMMMDLLYSLAAQKHPEVLCPALDPPSLEDILDKYLADLSWQDFWDAFPYDLRDQGSCLDELDALGLLLASATSRRRFERHFEELAASSGSTAGGHGSGEPWPLGSTAAASPRGSRARVAGGGRQQQSAPPPFSALPPAARQLGASALSMRVSRALLNSLLQQQQQQQAQHQQLHVVTVSPAAPGRMQAAAHAPPPPRHAPPPPSSMQHPYWRQLLQRVQGGEQRGAAMDAEAQLDSAAALTVAVPAGVDPAAASRLLAVAAAADAAAPGSSSSIAGETLAFAGITRTALRDAASAAAQAAAASQPPPAHDAVLRSMLSALGAQPPAEQLQQQAANAAGSGDAREGRSGSQAAGRRTATPAAAAGGTGVGGGSPPARLTGQRRNLQEMCDPEGYQQQQAAAAAAAAGDEPTSSGTGATAAGGEDEGNAASEAAAADTSSRADMSAVWRAVFKWLTGEDEDLLALVAEVVPYRLGGKTLRSEAETRQQLEALAASQRVPRKVVSAVADKLSQPCPTGDAQLVRLTASSGFSRSAAAAAAVLECCDRHGMRPLYVNLAGLSKEEDVAAAVLQGVVDSSASGAPAAAYAASPAPAPAAAEAGAAADDGNGAPAGAPTGQAGQQQQQHQEPEAGSGAPAPAPAAPAPPTVRPEQQPQPAAAGAEQQGAAGAGAGSDIVELYEAARAQALRVAAAEGPVAGNDGAGSDEQRGAASPPSSPPLVRSSTPPPDMSGCGEDAVDQLAAHLTLLGRWYASQPLLLLLDETDAASLHEDGRVLRELLMRLLCYLPQAVVAVVSSSCASECLDASALRHKDEPVLLQLHDGQLRMLGHQLPRSPLAMMHTYG